MTALVSVAGKALPEPATYTATTSDIVDSGRNVEGYVVGAIVRQDVAKIELSWRYLTVEQWAMILSLFKNAFYNPVTFFSQTSGQYETRDMYVSDRSAGMWYRNPRSHELQGWIDCKLNLIEV